jgi:hypothetical protein
MSMVTIWPAEFVATTDALTAGLSRGLSRKVSIRRSVLCGLRSFPIPATPYTTARLTLRTVIVYLNRRRLVVGLGGGALLGRTACKTRARKATGIAGG